MSTGGRVEGVAAHGKRRVMVLRTALALLAFGVMGALVLLGSERIAGYFDEGVRLATERVLPTSFPFMILSSLVCAMIDPTLYSRLDSITAKLFGISGAATGPMLIGGLSGFPLGARMTAELYRRGELERDEAERLLAYSDNPSVPFVIGVVGMGTLGDIKAGVILFLSLVISVVLIGYITRGKSRKITITRKIARQKYDFVESVKSAATSSLYTAAFVTLFYILIRAVRDAPLFEPVKTAVILLLEVAGATSYVGAKVGSAPVLQMGLMGFTLGFGGLSVAAQVAAMTEGAGLGMKKYFLIKIIQALLSSLIAMLLSFILI